MASATPPASPQQQPTPTLGEGTGSDDAEPAFPTYFPRPAVADRSLLPAVEQKVIVTVSISALGDVTDETLTQGVGNSLDQIVLDTVKTWRFHPASLNGTAVASTEQLVFPFNRNSSSSGASGTPG
jgi:protein TonB